MWISEMPVQVSMCGIKKKILGYNPEPGRFSLICFHIHELIKSTTANMGNFMSFFAGKMYFAIFNVISSCNIKLMICSLGRELSKGNHGLLSLETVLLCLPHKKELSVHYWRRENYIPVIWYSKCLFGY